MSYPQASSSRATIDPRVAGITDAPRIGGNVETRLQELGEVLARHAKALIIHTERLAPALIPPLEPPPNQKDAHPRPIMCPTAERLENLINETRNLTGALERLTQAVDL